MNDDIGVMGGAFVVGLIIGIIVTSLVISTPVIYYDKLLKVISVNVDKENESCSFILQQKMDNIQTEQGIIKTGKNIYLVNCPCSKYKIGQELEITNIRN